MKGRPRRTKLKVMAIPNVQAIARIVQTSEGEEAVIDFWSQEGYRLGSCDSYDEVLSRFEQRDISHIPVSLEEKQR